MDAARISEQDSLRPALAADLRRLGNSSIFSKPVEYIFLCVVGGGLHFYLILPTILRSTRTNALEDQASVGSLLAWLLACLCMWWYSRIARRRMLSRIASIPLSREKALKLLEWPNEIPQLHDSLPWYNPIKLEARPRSRRAWLRHVVSMLDWYAAPGRMMRIEWKIFSVLFVICLAMLLVSVMNAVFKNLSAPASLASFSFDVAIFVLLFGAGNSAELISQTRNEVHLDWLLNVLQKN